MQIKKKVNEDVNFWSYRLPQKRMNERGSYIFVEWWSANEINKSMIKLIFSQMVMYKRKNK